MNKKTILSLYQLNKIYLKGIHAIIDLNFELETGSICALLGPTGAGKSTTIGMICGLTIPSNGSIRFNGEQVTYSLLKYKSLIGVVYQHISLDLDLTAWQNLKIHALLCNIPKNIWRTKIDKLLKLAGLYNRKDNIVRSYSGGMKRKLQIIRALLHDPGLLILDEPTTGLDPVSREATSQHFTGNSSQLIIRRTSLEDLFIDITGKELN